MRSAPNQPSRRFVFRHFSLLVVLLMAVAAVFVFVVRSRAVVAPLAASGVWNQRYDEVDDLTRARRLPSPQLVGTPQRTTLDLNHLLPKDPRYFTYMGSLTTPPCSEGVLWLVMKQPVPVAPEQVGVFSRLYPMNARPVQPTSGRMIKEGL